MNMSVVTTHDRTGSPIAWREAGGIDRPVAVFLHGLGGNRTSWDPQLTALSADRRCVAWDAPGYGDSTASLGSLPEIADLAASWLHDLAGGPADVVGLSFGGMTAQHLALRHPGLVRSLALLDTSPAFGLDGTTTRESWQATRVDPMRHEPASPEHAGRVVDGLVGETCPVAVRQQAIDSMRAVPPATLAAACRALVDHNTLDSLHRITAPTLVMVGAQDTETPPAYARAISARIAGAQLSVVPGSGHLLNLENPVAVNDALRALWQRTGPTTGAAR